MEIDEALKKCKEKFIKLDFVVGLGKGNREGRDVIIMIVSKKDTKEIKKIPKKFEGIEIEIMEVGNIKPLK